MVDNATYTVAIAYQTGYANNATLTVGNGTPVVGAASSGWTYLVASGNATASGTILIKLSAASGTVYWDDATINTVNVVNPSLTWGQGFGYDGFGNLLTQNVLAGTAPGMSLSVNTANNQVTNTGAKYDGSGNLTSDGTSTYTYDENSRMATVGSISYGYGAADNKRIVAYNNFTPTAPTATLNLYGPDGRRLSSFSYAGSTYATITAATNYLYLGSKPLNYAEDRIGSNVSQAGVTASYWPYGETRSGTDTVEQQVFGTYVQDESGLLYADQRYMYQNWGRFLTPDPSDKNISYGNPGSWNRYGYLNGDPINGNDPSGQDLSDDDSSSDSSAYLPDDSGFGCYAGGGSGDVVYTPDGGIPTYYTGASAVTGPGLDTPIGGPYGALFSGPNSVGNALTGFDGGLVIMSGGAFLAGGTVAAGVAAVGMDAGGTLMLGSGSYVDAATGAAYSGYLEIAGVVGADALNIPPDVWYAMDAAQQEAAVLGNMIGALESGSQIVFTSNPALATGWTQFEYNYMINEGFQIVQQGTSWIVAP